MDSLTKEKRSWNMGQIHSRDTKPEKALRSMLYKMGYRYRLHRKDLPGTPDIVLPKYDSIIFLHGCFWHRHQGCKYAYTPKSKVEFWLNKFDETIKRDKDVELKLTEMGWKVLVVWECELKEPEALKAKIVEFLK